MPGSIAENFHEGSRSEYYAGLVLAAVGTASPVPRQEDTGVDYYCTLIEHEGQRWLVTDLFTVQVKGNLEPMSLQGPGKGQVHLAQSHGKPRIWMGMNEHQTSYLSRCSGV